MSGIAENFKNGVLVSNPVFVLLLGLCPTLAVSTSIDNAIGMTGAVLFVLLLSNIIVSIIRKWIPESVRIPVFIVIIATFVTIVDLILKAYFPPLSKSLGIFVPLIVVNCIILGRAEAFASKNTILDSAADAFGIATGFLLAIFIISFIREVLGSGKLAFFGLFELSIPGLSTHPLSIFILPMGAFMVIGLLLALFRHTGVVRNE